MLKTDASNRVITRVLLQLYLNSEQYSITFLYKTIALTKYNYKIYNKKILVIV